MPYSEVPRNGTCSFVFFVFLSLLFLFYPATSHAASIGEILERIFRTRQPPKTPCLIAVSPMVQAGEENEKYRIKTPEQMRRFISNVIQNVGASDYKRPVIKDDQDIPSRCKEGWWAEAGQYSRNNYQACMKEWRDKVDKITGCSASEIYIAGLMLPLKGDAKLIITDNDFSRVESADVSRGEDLGSLSRSLGRAIKRGIEQYKNAKKK